MPSAYSNIVSVTLSSVPTTPALSASTSVNNVALSWSASTVSGSTIANYLLYRSTDGVSFSLYQTLGGSTLAYDDDGLPTGDFWYYVIAKAASGTLSAHSNTVEAASEAPVLLSFNFTAGIPVDALTATAAPTAVSAAGITSSLTTDSTTVTPAGGGAFVEHSWAYSGDPGIVIDDPTADTTTATSASTAPGATLTGTGTDTVTDQYGQSVQVPVAIGMVRRALPTVSLSTTSLSVTGITSTLTTPPVTVTPGPAGNGPFTYSAAFTVGGAGISILNGTTAAPAAQATSVGAGADLTGTMVVTVTDAYGQPVASQNISVELKRPALPTVGLSSTSMSYLGTSSSPTTNGVLATPGPSANAPFTHNFHFTVGGTSLSVKNGTSATAEVGGTGLTPATYTGTVVDTVTDQYGQSVNSANIAASVDVVAAASFVIDSGEYTDNSNPSFPAYNYGYSQHPALGGIPAFGSLVSSSNIPPWATGLCGFYTEYVPGAGSVYTTYVQFFANSDPGAAALNSAAYQYAATNIGAGAEIITGSYSAYNYNATSKIATWTYDSTRYWDAATTGVDYTSVFRSTP